MNIPEGKNIYFASDQHLGAPNKQASFVREQKFIDWLDIIKEDAAVLFLVGDLFDFWFEYETVVPKGFVRVLGKLANMADSGIKIHYFVGNHDLWMKGYFEEELNIPVYHEPREFTFNGTTFFIGHGDGLGPDDKGFKRMKKVFTCAFSKWIFKWLHPDLGVRLGQYLSVKNKMISGDEDSTFLGQDKEWLVQYAKRKESQQHRDHFIFGHRHLPLEIIINAETGAKYTNLGDWIVHFTYAMFDGDELHLKKFKN